MDSRAQELHAVKETPAQWEQRLDSRAQRRVISEELDEALSAGERRLKAKENEVHRLERQRAKLLQRIEDARPYAESRFVTRSRDGARETIARCQRELRELDAKLLEVR